MTFQSHAVVVWTQKSVKLFLFNLFSYYFIDEMRDDNNSIFKDFSPWLLQMYVSNRLHSRFWKSVFMTFEGSASFLERETLFLRYTVKRMWAHAVRNFQTVDRGDGPQRSVSPICISLFTESRYEWRTEKGLLLWSSSISSIWFSLLFSKFWNVLIFYPIR